MTDQKTTAYRDPDDPVVVAEATHLYREMERVQRLSNAYAAIGDLESWMRRHRDLLVKNGGDDARSALSLIIVAYNRLLRGVASRDVEGDDHG